eukprot:2538174-Amphidinium_carterae.1
MDDSMNLQKTSSKICSVLSSDMLKSTKTPCHMRTTIGWSSHRCRFMHWNTCPKLRLSLPLLHRSQSGCKSLMLCQHTAV